MIEKEKHIGEAKMTEQPKKPLRLTINNGAVQTKHIADGAVSTPKIKDKAVTPDKLSQDVQSTLVLPITNSLDEKYVNKTNELYDMVSSLQVGGIALSNQLGDREDIGITQKALTKIIGEIWQAIEDPSHHVFDFILTAVPEFSYSETPADIAITADSSQTISNFDNIKIYVNDELVAESNDVSVYTTHCNITHTSTIKAVGIILGKTVTKEKVVHVEVPFFMGSGSTYTDVINEECRKELEGTLEGAYDMTVKNTGEYIFIIIPISRKDEFRRADMNGLGMKIEIPMNATVLDDYVVYKSLNTYQAGIYNIDIDINS